MNNDRRKQIDKAKEDVDQIKKEIDALAADEQTGDADQDALADFEENWTSRLDDIRTEVETLKDEEQDYYDNMPEDLQGGDKGTNAEEAISALQDAEDSLEELTSVEETGALVRMFHEKYDDITSRLSDATA